MVNRFALKVRSCFDSHIRASLFFGGGGGGGSVPAEMRPILSFSRFLLLHRLFLKVTKYILTTDCHETWFWTIICGASPSALFLSTVCCKIVYGVLRNQFQWTVSLRKMTIMTILEALRWYFTSKRFFHCTSWNFTRGCPVTTSKLRLCFLGIKAKLEPNKIQLARVC